VWVYKWSVNSITYPNPVYIHIYYMTISTASVFCYSLRRISHRVLCCCVVCVVRWTTRRCAERFLVAAWATRHRDVPVMWERQLLYLPKRCILWKLRRICKFRSDSFLNNTVQCHGGCTNVSLAFNLSAITNGRTRLCHFIWGYIN
jgi:hypothetical protein